MEVVIGLIGFAFLGVIVAGSVIAIANAALPKRVRELRNEVRTLESRLQALETFHAAEQNPATESEPLPDYPPEPEPDHQDLNPETEETPRAYHPALRRFSRLEGRFAGYWTGILGVLALVAGFSFLAVLTALRLGEFSRFLMLCVVALLFYGGSVAIRRRSGGELFAAWFRSAAGALVLFACVGASAVPWLRWVQSEPHGYALLAAGLAVNLWFALNGPYQLFAAFHTLISLTALAVAPPQITVLAAAAIVTAISTLPRRQDGRPVHTLVSETVFFAFVVLWTIRHPGSPLVAEGVALGALIMGLMPVLLGPYLFRDTGSSVMTLTSRGAAWLFLAAGTLGVGQSLPQISLVFLVLALAAYLPGRFFAPPGTSVRVLDTTAGLVLAVLAGVTLVRLDLDLYSAVAVAAGVALLAAFDLRREHLPVTIALSVATALTGVLAVGWYIAVPPFPVVSVRPQEPGAAAVVTALIALASLSEGRFLFLQRRTPGRLLAVIFLLAALGLMAAVRSIEGAPLWLRYSGVAVLPLAAVAAVVARGAGKTSWFPLGVVALAVVAHITALAGAPGLSVLPMGERVLHGVLLMAFAVVAAGAPSRVGSLPGVLLAAADMALLISVVTAPREPWVGLALWTLSAAGLYGGRSLLVSRRGELAHSVAVAGGGTALAAALISLFSLVDGSAAEQTSARVLLAALVTATLVLWGRRSTAGPRAPRRVFIVSAVVFLLVAAGAEARREYIGVILTVLAPLLLLAGFRGPRFLRMLFPLSTGVFWLSLVFLAVPALFSGTLFAGTLRVTVFSGEWYRAVVAAGFAAGYLALSWTLRSHWRLPVEEEGPAAARWKEAVGAHLYPALFLPFFVTLGFFFGFTFSGPVLTALLIIESFLVFSLGILLSEKSFRPFAYGLLVVSLARLILLDMAEADTLERALVFLIAGAVLLGMNWMYNRFRPPAQDAAKDR